MGRRHLIRGIKVCAHCGCGFDGFRARDARGRYCSPGCLAAARAAHRRRVVPPADSGSPSPLMAG